MIRAVTTSRTILITGASSGIAAALSVLRAQCGGQTEMNRGAAAWPVGIPVERGVATMARLVGRRVDPRGVPVLPWTIVAMILKLLPDVLLRRRP